MGKELTKGKLGGQAVIEGVMMKGPESYSVAVRKPDHKIEVKLEKYQSMGDKYSICKLPFVRGIFSFIESLMIGMKTLMYSSSFYEDEEEESKADKLLKDIFKEKAESVIIGLTVFVSVIIAIALFMMFPAVIAELLSKVIKNNVILSIIEGFIRLLIFILYILMISQMEDIKRLFMYHGAEHKTINCYESGKELTPENIKKHSRYHKRCGTSFLFFVMIVSIFVFMFITTDIIWLRFVLRLCLIPVVASFSYELIYLAGRTDNLFFTILSKPGMWIQKLTTKEPDEEMIQVAIISVESVLYGMAYVDAVNKAQGLGKFKVKETSKESSMDEVEEYSEEYYEKFDEDYEEIQYEEVDHFMEEENSEVIEKVEVEEVATEKKQEEVKKAEEAKEETLKEENSEVIEKVEVATEKKQEKNEIAEKVKEENKKDENSEVIENSDVTIEKNKEEVEFAEKAKEEKTKVLDKNKTQKNGNKNKSRNKKSRKR